MTHFDSLGKLYNKLCSTAGCSLAAFQAAPFFLNLSWFHEVLVSAAASSPAFGVRHPFSGSISSLHPPQSHVKRRIKNREQHHTEDTEQYRLLSAGPTERPVFISSIVRSLFQSHGCSTLLGYTSSPPGINVFWFIWRRVIFLLYM